MSDLLTESWQTLLSRYPHYHQQGLQVLFGSDYVATLADKQFAHVEELLQSGDLDQPYRAESYRLKLSILLDDIADEAMLHQQLRRFRQREMMRIIWRDLAGLAPLSETVAELSALADSCIQQALSVLHAWQCEALGTPCNQDGEPQEMVVLAMGKLGAGELNLSSDIDLIFTFPEAGETQGGRKSLSNEEFFTRLGQKLIQALDAPTVDGFVFRVDMRLRPFGDSGALVSSFDAMEDYYQTQGREWERYAMIKARAVTGSDEAIVTLMSLLRPFVYRRYLDYGVFDALREMKSMISGQLDRKGLGDNIKLGLGGIREIEFIGQVFQLIYGGRDLALQQRPILTILPILAEREILAADVVTELEQAYDFLRRVEHRLQAWADQQTHLLPKEEEAQLRVAKTMGFDSWTAFENKLNVHRTHVQAHFEQLLAPQVAENDEKSMSLFHASESELSQYLSTLGFNHADDSAAILITLLDSHAYRNIDNTGKERLEKVLPLLIETMTEFDAPDQCLVRLAPLVESIMRRSAYMALLVENPKALFQLVKLCAASPWISQKLTQYPMLLDELLDSRTLYIIPTAAEQKNALISSLAEVDSTDLEQHMYLLREFKQVTTLHIAAADIMDRLPVMKVADQLSYLADIQLEQVMRLAWQHLVAKHGRPQGVSSDNLAESGFTVLAYGKLGGLELGYGSDLDLVFLFDDSEVNKRVTEGERSVDICVFYTRLAQRMIHLLSTVTTNGLLYEVDMRLRPNGQSGLLVTGMSGFEDYQQNDAWTWEHQALVRARCVAGDVNLAEQVSQIRRQVLMVPRSQQELVSDVGNMRAKMRKQLDKSKADVFDLKQGIGGIADIEFMVQYALLAWSRELPELLVFTDNIRIIESLKATDKLSEEDSNILAGAYRFYRDLANHCVLQNTETVVPISKVAVYQPQVKAIWQRWLG